MHEIINNLPKRFLVCDEFRITLEERFFFTQDVLYIFKKFFSQNFSHSF